MVMGLRTDDLAVFCEKYYPDSGYLISQNRKLQIIKNYQSRMKPEREILEG
jgi:hypothetical protein